MNSTVRSATPTADTSPHVNNHTTTTAAATDPRFSCNICFDDVSDPVVTQCGHLYCWGCLFRWIEPGLTTAERQALNLTTPVHGGHHVDQSHRVCPVCKSPCSVASVIPIYVRNAEPVDRNQHGTSTKISSTNNNNSNNEEDHTSSSPTTHPEQRNLDHDSPESRDPSTVPELHDPPGSPSSSSSSSHFGLRQRLRFRSTDSNSQPTGTLSSTDATVEEEEGEEGEVVPARPTVRRRALSENAVRQLEQQQQLATSQYGNINDYNSNNRTLMITQGLAMGLHRALGPTATAATSTSGTNTPATPVIPPLHRREGHGSTAHHPSFNASTNLEETDPDATEFLSRILLMLGSFVVLCLLLF